MPLGVIRRGSTHGNVSPLHVSPLTVFFVQVLAFGLVILTAPASGATTNTAIPIENDFWAGFGVVGGSGIRGAFGS